MGNKGMCVKLKGSTEVQDEYTELAKAVIVQAVQDWVALRTPGRWPKNLPEATGDETERQRIREFELRQVERFFMSEEFKLYTDIDPQKLLDHLYETYEGENIEKAG